MTKVLCLADRPLGERCLAYLRGQNSCQLAGIVSRPDGSGHWWGASTFEARAKDWGIRWFDHSAPLPEIVCATQPDVIISVLFTKRVPPGIVRSIRCLNLHCAPLPEYRGFNATLWAILNEETTFGATLHEMADGLDEGDVVEKSTFDIPGGTTNIGLYEAAHHAAFEIFRKRLENIVSGQYATWPQAGQARYYRKDDLPLREVHLSWSPRKIATYARAFYFPPFDPAYVVVSGQRINLIPT